MWFVCLLLLLLSIFLFFQTERARLPRHVCCITSPLSRMKHQRKQDSLKKRLIIPTGVDGTMTMALSRVLQSFASVVFLALLSSWAGSKAVNVLCDVLGLASAMYINRDGVEIPNPDPSSGLYIRSRSGELVKVGIPSDYLAFQIGIQILY